MSRKKFGLCELCGREKPLTFHHLIPKKVHKNKWFRKNFSKEDRLFLGIDVCRECHDHIHVIFSEKELGRQFNTLELISSHPEIIKFVQWIKDR